MLLFDFYSYYLYVDSIASYCLICMYMCKKNRAVATNYGTTRKLTLDRIFVRQSQRRKTFASNFYAFFGMTCDLRVASPGSTGLKNEVKKGYR